MEKSQEQNIIQSYVRIFHQKILEKYNEKFKQKVNKCNQLNERSVLAGFGFLDQESGQINIVSLGLGNRSLPQQLLQKEFQNLHDCHAEILSKRGLQRFILDQILILLNKRGQDEKNFQQNEIVYLEEVQNRKFKIKDKYKLLMYISQLPCGDCCLRQISVENDNKEKNKIEYISKNSLTGAKPLRDFQIQENNQKIYNEFNILRTKPSRSDTPFHKKTNSLSCSDKIMKWCWVGVQGSLVGQFLEPLFIDQILIEGKGLFQIQGKIKDSFDLIKRTKQFKNENEILKVQFQSHIKQFNKMKITKTENINFPISRDLLQENQIPNYMDFSMIFVNTQQEIVETVIGTTGLKQGSSKQTKNFKFLSQLSKREIFLIYCKIKNQIQDCNQKQFNYLNEKSLNQTYNQQVLLIKNGFQEWTQGKKQFEDFQLQI